MKATWWAGFGGVICLWAGAVMGPSVTNQFAARSWIPIDATVVEITNHPKSATLSYEYFRDGLPIQNDTFAFLTEGTLNDKQYINENFEVGQNITVFMNPSNPKQSVVQRRPLRLEYLWKQLVAVFATSLITMFYLEKLVGLVIGRDKTTETQGEA